MRGTCLFALLGILLCGGASAVASSHLTCVNSYNVPNTTPVAFNFDVQVQSSNSGGSGGGAAKAVSSLVVVLPLNSTYAALYHLASNSLHSSSCVLTENPNSSTSIEITMKDVTFPELKMLSGAYFTNDVAGPLIQLTIAYASISTQFD
ncbi:hypothetical protein ACPOL_5862 [Acidisarcina polymorpha]|uniref:Uncharacterized protein n=1 Tax=Acidisarcina polymorpha TaxID=2211140 RepID=A0A2Z5G976_9BACT|nr:hypothetical protein [Acidisarcina polymorpha]AXC15106.1 hypothetical protein ACPOL_5862 [Acidisarcina polymorpha]